MNYRVFSYVSPNNQRTWSNIYGYDSSVSNPNYSPRYELFVLTRITTDADINIQLFEKMLIDDIQSFYENNSNQYKDNIEKLENAIWKMKTKMEILLSKEEEIIQKGIDMEMVITIFTGEYMYICVIGESSVFLFRNNKLIEISKGLIDLNMSGFAKTGSLKVEQNDRVILATSSFVSKNLDFLVNLSATLDLNLLSQVIPTVGGSFLLIADKSLPWKEQNDQSEKVVNVQIDDKKTSTAELTAKDIPENISIEKNNNIEANLSNANYVDHIEKNTLQSLADNYYGQSNTDSNNYIRVKSNSLANQIRFNLQSLISFVNSYKSRLLFGISQSNKLIQNYVNLSRKIYKKIVAGILHKDTTFFVVTKKIFKQTYGTLKTFIQFLLLRFNLSYQRYTKLNKHDIRKRNRRLLFIGICVLCIYLFVTFRNAELERIEKQRVAEIQNTLYKLASEFDQVDSAAHSVNLNNIEYKLDLIKKINNLQNNLNTQINLLTSDINNLENNRQFVASLHNLNKSLSLLYNKVLNLQEINETNLRILADFTRLFPQSEVVDIAFTSITGQKLVYAVDIKNNNVYKLNVNNNSITTVSTNNLNNFISPRIIFTDANQKILVYDSSTNYSIIRIDPTNNDAIQKINIPYQDTINVVAAETFTNGSIYELRTSPNAYIHRRLPSGNSFMSGGGNYVTTNPPNWRVDPDFANAIDIAVPYEIYVLIKGQGIKRYLSGGSNSITPQTYKNLLPEDLDSLKTATAFDVKLKYMVVGDSINKRILLFEITQDNVKNIVFRQQFKYLGSGNIFSNIREVILNEYSNEEGGEIYILDNNRIIFLSFK
ncbi:MAG: hypothetical protein NZZ41_05250 [Candidatus Dojkabacteria bacterium]|nr:hypothetical protein [Candidatus Dojkabacteria bacterium]